MNTHNKFQIGVIMDLGYSSSESDSAEINTKQTSLKNINVEKNHETIVPTKPDIDLKGIFKLTQQKVIKPRKVKDRGNRIHQAISKVLSEKVIIESKTKFPINGDEDRRDIANIENKIAEKKKGIPIEAKISELNMKDFYKQNQREIESGQLDGERQDNIGNIVYHREAGHSNAGRLDRVIQFNINNEEKIMYQNKEKIAKEKAIAREKFNAGRG